MSEQAERAQIPIFPLENVVLFPRVQVPLHIFEPRYRQMARAALDGERTIGMAVVRPEGGGDMKNTPPVYSTGCMGRIERADELPGGRFNLVLQGTSRFEIESEEAPDAERLYRIANVRLLTDSFADEDRPRVLSLRGEVYELMRQLLSIIAPTRVEIFEQQPITQVDDETFVNAMSQSIDFATPEKQALLEAGCVRERYEHLAEFMRFRLAELTSGGSSGTSVVQ